jgi:hypothetical protein
MKSTRNFFGDLLGRSGLCAIQDRHQWSPVRQLGRILDVHLGEVDSFVRNQKKKRKKEAQEHSELF